MISAMRKDLFLEDGDLDAARAYLAQNGLLPILEQNRNERQIPPQYRDLARLHSLARKRKVFTVLEFGVGWSTIVFADALRRNKNDWDLLENKPNVRKSHPFMNYSVDSSPDWISNTEKKIPDDLRPHTKIAYSKVEAGTFCGKICHYYNTVPDIVPDLIYLDGPDTMAVEGHLSGLTWKNNGRVVMAADLLLMEPILLPGTMLIVDGRTSNARFLKAHFYRNWDYLWDKASDVTVMELREEPIGLFNEEDLRYRLGLFFDQWTSIDSRG